MKNLIGISGKIGSGKDEVFRIIQKLTNSSFENRKFADQLKDTVCMWIGCTREQLEDREFKETPLGKDWNKTIWHISSVDNNELETFLSKEEAYNSLSHWDENYMPHTFVEKEEVIMTPRLMLQLLGTEAGRRIIHPNIWVNALFADFKKKTLRWDSEGNSTFDSLPNWVITDCRFPNEAEAIKSRGGIVIRLQRGDGNTSSHASETGLDDFDGFNHFIDNNGTIEDLENQVEHILKLEGIL